MARLGGEVGLIATLDVGQPHLSGKSAS